MKSLGLFTRLSSIKVYALTALALLALGGPARAQAPNPNNWTVTDPNGNPARSNPGPDGGWCLTGPMTITTTPTGVYQHMLNDSVNWFILSPCPIPAPSALGNGLALGAEAPGWGAVDFSTGSGSGSASVTAGADSTQSATLTYNPPAGDATTPPDHVDLLLTTSLETKVATDYADMGAVIADELNEEQDIGIDTSGLDISGLLAQTPSLSSSITATDTLGDQLSASASEQDVTWDSDNEDWDFYEPTSVVTRHLVRVPVVNGVGTVSVGGHIAATMSNDSSHFKDLWGGYGGAGAWAWAYISTTAAIDSREVGMTTSLDGLPQNATAAANSDPTNRQLTAYASLNWKVQDDDSPSIPFYDGYANYFLNATGFTPTSYAWQTSQPPFVQSMATPDDLIWQLPDYSVGEKHFHFDLGDDFTRFPQTTTVTGTASGTDPSFGPFCGAATVTVTWQSPWAGTGSGGGGPLSLTPAAGADLILYDGGNGTAVPSEQVQAGQVILVGGQRYVVLTIQQNADGTLTFFLAPAPPLNPQPDDDVMALVAEYQQRTQQAIAVGKIGLQLGFEGYNQLGQAYVLGPLTELTAPQLIELLGEATTVIGRSLEGTQAAEYYTALGSYGASLLPGLAQKVANLEAGVAAGTASEADLAAANQALEQTQICISICDQASADMGSTYVQYDSTGTEVQNAVLDAQDWQAETAAGKNCFAAGTLVWMADGSQKPIEQVRAGDVVLSRDPQTGMTAAKAVLRTFRHQADATVSLRFPGGDVLQCTAGHPFYVSGQGFVPAGRLALGSSIVTRAGPLLALSGSERQSVPTTVYNFEVADFHTYFVGKSGLWVHNICEIPPGTEIGTEVLINDSNEEPITDLDYIRTDAQGVHWVGETKLLTGLDFTGDTADRELQKERIITKLIGTNLTGIMDKNGLPIEGQLDKYLDALESGDGQLAEYFGTSDPATLMQMLKNGQIRIAYEGTASIMTQEMQFRIMHALRMWEEAHSAELGGLPVGMKLPPAP